VAGGRPHGTLLEALSLENLDNQRAVVKNEKRSSYDNQPYGTWQEKILGHLYRTASVSPPTIGSMEDLDAASIEDVAAFFRTYYAPNNAVLSIVGTWTRPGPRLGREVLRAARSKPAIPAFHAEELPLTLGGERRETVPDRVPLPRIYVGYRAPTLGDRACMRSRSRPRCWPAQGEPPPPTARPRRADCAGRGHVRPRVLIRTVGLHGLGDRAAGCHEPGGRGRLFDELAGWVATSSATMSSPARRR